MSTPAATATFSDSTRPAPADGHDRVALGPHAFPQALALVAQHEDDRAAEREAHGARASRARPHRPRARRAARSRASVSARSVVRAR